MCINVNVHHFKRIDACQSYHSLYRKSRFSMTSEILVNVEEFIKEFGDSINID